MTDNIDNLSAEERALMDSFLTRRPDLAKCQESLLQLHQQLVRCYDGGGTLYTCGNGGSHADAVHIVGELMKSFERRRPLPAELVAKLRNLPHGEVLAGNLEAGLRAQVLGGSGALKTAVENDIPVPGIAFAQELSVLIRPGDVLL